MRYRQTEFAQAETGRLVGIRHDVNVAMPGEYSRKRGAALLGQHSGKFALYLIFQLLGLAQYCHTIAIDQKQKLCHYSTFRCKIKGG